MTQKFALLLVLIVFLSCALCQAETISFPGSRSVVAAAVDANGTQTDRTSMSEKRYLSSQAHEIPCPLPRRTAKRSFELRGKRVWRTSAYTAGCCVSGVFACGEAGTCGTGVDAHYVADTRQTLLAMSGHSQLFQDV